MPPVEGALAQLSQHPGNPQLQRFDPNARTFSTVQPQEIDSLSFKNVKITSHPQDKYSFLFRAPDSNIYRYNNPGVDIQENYPTLSDGTKKFDLSVYNGRLWYKETKPLVVQSGVGSSHQSEEAEQERRSQILSDYLKHSDLPTIDPNMEWVKRENGDYFQRPINRSSQRMYEDPDLSNREKSPSEKDADEEKPPSV
jgi:hypothetical protein